MSDLELFLDLDNRRNNERYQLDQPLLAGGHKAKLLNVSRSGLRLVVESKQDQDHIDLIVGGRLRIVGERVWSKRVGPGHKVVGVRFSGAEDLLKLRSWLSKVA
jgi:DNA-binding FadR family transcriptional regulator